MPRGGSRPGAGRKKGTVSEQSRQKRALAAKIAAEGVTPLEVMTEAMRHFHREAHAGPSLQVGKLMQAVAIAEKLAPYVHPKLTAVSTELTGKDGAPLVPSEIQITFVRPPEDSGAVPGKA